MNGRPAPDAEEATRIARLGAASGSGDAEALVEALEAALDGGPDALEPDDVEEYLLQTYLFAGFPRTINAFFTWQGWAAEHGGRGAIVMEPDDVAGWRERGEELCRVIYAGTYEALQTRLARLHPALADWTLIEGYGKVLARPGPDAARRELAALGTLVVLDAERQLVAHVKGALNAGVPYEALSAALLSVAERWERRETVEPVLGRLRPVEKP